MQATPARVMALTMAGRLPHSRKQAMVARKEGISTRAAIAVLIIISPPGRVPLLIEIPQ